jgi:ADP-ribosylglycohydrolase
MIGAIAGDIIGSVYEHGRIKEKDFPLFDPRCTFTDGSVLTVAVAKAIISFLDSSSYEDAVRNAVSLGCDSDTLACIAGAIAEAFYGGVPQFIQDKAMGILDEYMRSIAVKFATKYRGRDLRIGREDFKE